MTHGVIFPSQLTIKELRPARHLTDRSSFSGIELFASRSVFSLYNLNSSSVSEDLNISTLAGQPLRI